MQTRSLGWIAMASMALSLLACSHPIEIVGEGDVVSATGSRDCSLDAFRAGDETCSVNFIYGEYYETYFAVPHSGWQFEKWLNYCTDDTLGECSFTIPGHVVDKAAGVQVPPLVAVFTRASGFEQVENGPSDLPADQSKPVTRPAPAPEPKPETKPNLETKPAPAPKPKPVTQPKPETKPAPAPKPVTQPKPETKPAPVSEPRSPAPETTPVPAPPTAPVSQPAAVPKPVAVSKPATESATEPAASTAATPAAIPAADSATPERSMRTVKLRWTPPARRENGAALSINEIHRYEIIASPVTGGQSQVYIVKDTGSNSYTIRNLEPVAYEFHIVAVDKLGLSSKPSASVVLK